MTNSQQKSKQEQTSDEFENRLLEIARKTITAAVRGKPTPEFNITQERLKQKLGVFVTLQKQGQLRGCIGLIESDLPLYKGVQKMAKAAALDDPRFPPVRPEELKDIKLEISVLTKPEKVADVSEIEPGRHGVIIKNGFKRGVFLPQVAEEQGYDREQFLSSLCTHKLGLPADAWQNEDSKILKFEAEVYPE